MSLDPTECKLDPLPYHLELRDYLQSEERELWAWFASAQAQANYTENLRTELLKSTYRLDAEVHPEVYQAVAEAKARLELDIPVTVYQGQSSSTPNAALYFIPGEGHIVLSGPVLSLLEATELRSVIGHELAHYRLWQCEGGELHTTDRLVNTVAQDPRASASHGETARRLQLYTEIFADRGSFCVTGDINPVVAALVKIDTGLRQVSGAGYLKQAEEIFGKGVVSTKELSHPETFIRARALALWQQQRQDAEPQISNMIEGTISLDELDLLAQRRLVKSTRALLEQLLQPKWFQTEAVLGHAKLFFDDFKPAKANDPTKLDEFRSSEARLREYVCYLLLDFVTADPELEQLPLAAALSLTRQLDLDDPFEKLAAKELKMKVRDLRKIKEQAAEMLAKAEVAHE